MADTLLGGIVINEVLVDPNGTINFDTDGNGTAGSTDEYVELYNSSDVAIDISGVELWDAGVGKWFTFPDGTVLEPGAHALVMTGVQSGGSLPTGDTNDLFFDAGRGSALINNGGDNIIVYDPANDEYIAATFNGDVLDDPTTGVGGYSRFSATATQSGSGEDFGFDTDGQSLQRASDGADVFADDTPTPGTTNVCFVKGTAFETPDGPKLVDALSPGDLVNTLDRGPKRVKWVYSVTWSAEIVGAQPNLAPVLIRKGALGNGLPWRDLRVSQQHRILVASAISQRMFGCVEVLLAAKHLAALPGVEIDCREKPVTYYHVMLDRHEVLIADGIPAESLYLGAEAMKAIPPKGLRQIEVMLGKTIEQLGQTAQIRARPFAESRRARTLVARHAKNDKPLIAAPLYQNASRAAARSGHRVMI
ncbi:Hint domain-containing protein [Arenibacterium sp. CAU 1754]